VAALAGALAAQVMALGTPRPAPAPSGMPEQTVRQELAALRVAVQDAQAAGWDWRQFERCIDHHVPLRGGRSPVMWKTSRADCWGRP
jgi:hypothetical protein